jgi:hypothetical protein
MPAAVPESFVDEIWRFKRPLIIYNMRWHLARFPRDLIDHWWNECGGLPWPTSNVAYRAWKAGERPGKLYRGALWKPALRVIEGGVRRG